ncbi:MAG: nucleotidyltransferase family protein [Myxococcota bacterium]
MERVLTAEPEARWAYLFGSAARGQGDWRDLDVGVVTSRGFGLLDLGRLASALEEATRERVDVVDLGAAPPIFVHDILRGRTRLLLDRERGARLDWESEQISRALDFLPTYQETLAAWRSRVREVTP